MKTNFRISIVLFSMLASISFSNMLVAKGTATPTTVSPKAEYDDEPYHFFVISDWGWNGQLKQKEVASAMANYAEIKEPEFIVSCGDNFQVNGIASTQDPIWMFSFENIYTALALQVDWYPVLGNHDYKGNTQAQIDYSKISRRWCMPSHYYTMVKKISDSVSIRLIFMDTPPLIDEYYRKEGYPDVFKQDTAAQMKWLKDILMNSKEQWKLVFGHHPVYSASPKHGDTPELTKKLKPLFDKYNVHYYFSGHDHDMQHLKDKNASPEYIVTGVGGKPRKCATNTMSIYSNSTPGFGCLTFYADSVYFDFIDSNAKSVYQTKRSYKK